MRHRNGVALKRPGGAQEEAQGGQLNPIFVAPYSSGLKLHGMDPLADSPFSLLDLHSALHLVTDAVHEDDALCLALTCRVLRDLLWKRFPLKWAWTEGYVPYNIAWSGDRALDKRMKEKFKNVYASTRIRTRDSAVTMTVERLVWARSLNQPWPGSRPGWPSGWTDFLVHSVARHGAQESL